MEDEDEDEDEDGRGEEEIAGTWLANVTTP